MCARGYQSLLTEFFVRRHTIQQDQIIASVDRQRTGVPTGYGEYLMHSTLSYPRYSLACFSNGPENSAGINAVSSIRTPKYRRRKNSKDYTYERLTNTGRSSPKTSSPGRYGAIVALVRIRSGKILTQASVFTAWHRLDRASPLI